MRRLGAAIIAVSLVVVGGLSGCVLPLPADRVVGRAVTVDPLTIKVGETTREDVVQRLGDPDAIWVDERVFAYRWRHINTLIIGRLLGVEISQGGAKLSARTNCYSSNSMTPVWCTAWIARGGRRAWNSAIS